MVLIRKCIGNWPDNYNGRTWIGRSTVPSYFLNGHVEYLSNMTDIALSPPSPRLFLGDRYSSSKSLDSAMSLNMSFPLPNSGSYPVVKHSRLGSQHAMWERRCTNHLAIG